MPPSDQEIVRRGVLLGAEVVTMTSRLSFPPAVTVKAVCGRWQRHEASPLGRETPRRASPLSRLGIYCAKSLRLGVDTFTASWPSRLSLTQRTFRPEPWLYLHLPLTLLPDTVFLSQLHQTRCTPSMQHHISVHLWMLTPYPTSPSGRCLPGKLPLLPHNSLQQPSPGRHLL